jgi:UDP-3-O-[3-hydroxymyristoyl] glucosamine N-acyltransferase
VHTTGSLAATLGAELIGPSDLEIRGLETLDRAGPGMMSFIRDAANASRWDASKASAALVTRGALPPDHDPSARALLVVENADLALIAVLDLFAPKDRVRAPGIHPTATIDPDARVDPLAHVGPQCVVEAGATIGPGSVLVARVYVGVNASIGAKSTLHPGVTIMERCQVGNGCTLYPGVVVGADGFGYRPDPKTGMPLKVPHLGIVQIGHGVEIGANSAIDRAKFGATVIGDGTKIDNLVQIGHNCTIGRCCLLCGQVAVGGSVTIGDGAILGGAASVRDNVNIGAMARIAGRAGVVDDVEPGGDRFGLPAIPGREALKIHHATRRLRSFFHRVRDLEKLVMGKEGAAALDAADSADGGSRA